MRYLATQCSSVRHHAAVTVRAVGVCTSQLGYSQVQENKVNNNNNGNDNYNLLSVCFKKVHIPFSFLHRGQVLVSHPTVFPVGLVSLKPNIERSFSLFFTCFIYWFCIFCTALYMLCNVYAFCILILQLLEGLQSSLAISKIPSISHDKGQRSQNRNASRGKIWCAEFASKFCFKFTLRHDRNLLLDCDREQNLRGGPVAHLLLARESSSADN